MTKAFKPSPSPKLTNLLPSEIARSFAEDRGEWLAARVARFSGPGQAIFVLIHADDGVLWGRVSKDEIITPPTSDWTPPLRSRTIQQCRVFGTQGELFIWREAENVWRGREVMEDGGIDYRPIHESHILYGNRVHNSRTALTDFTPVFEMTTGMRQIVPIAVTQADFDAPSNKRVTLAVVHYLGEDGDGQSRIVCSRLRAVELRQV